MYYVKARTAPVYCFPFATLIAIILSSQGNINVFTAANAVIASYFLSLAVYIYNDLTDFEVDKVNKTNRPSTSGVDTSALRPLSSLSLLLLLF